MSICISSFVKRLLKYFALLFWIYCSLSNCIQLIELQFYSYIFFVQFFCQICFSLWLGRSIIKYKYIHNVFITNFNECILYNANIGLMSKSFNVMKPNLSNVFLLLIISLLYVRILCLCQGCKSILFYSRNLVIFIFTFRAKIHKLSFVFML